MFKADPALWDADANPRRLYVASEREACLVKLAWLHVIRETHEATGELLACTV